MRNGLAWVLGMLCLTGCASMQDTHYSCANQCRSEWAWVSASKSPLKIVWPSNFGHGWKAGYYDVATGGGGQPPALPPPAYWTAHYQSVRGQDAIGEWYRGFQEGALQAEQGGAGQFHYIRSVGMLAQQGETPAILGSEVERLPPPAALEVGRAAGLQRPEVIARKSGQSRL